MAGELTEFLTNLCTNEDLRESFINDKFRTMRTHNVPEEHIELVVNKKYDEIKNVLGAGYDIATNTIIGAFQI